MIKILVDSREASLISCIKERDLDRYAHSISMEVQALDIGDVHICLANLIWVFERKTVPDLLASIKDGRYKEQKSRLLASKHYITYVIEGGDIISSKYERQQHILSGVYMHSMYRDNIHIAFTRNVSETCTFLLTLAAKMIDNPQYFSNNNESNTEYIDCVKIKTKKINNITPDICYLMQLAQIPSISTVIAKNIQKIYPTMRDLIKALDESEDKMQVLCNIEKIGPEKATKILQYLYYNP